MAVEWRAMAKRLLIDENWAEIFSGLENRVNKQLTGSNEQIEPRFKDFLRNELLAAATNQALATKQACSEAVQSLEKKVDTKFAENDDRLGQHFACIGRIEEKGANADRQLHQVLEEIERLHWVLAVAGALAASPQRARAVFDAQALTQDIDLCISRISRKTFSLAAVSAALEE